MLKLQGLGNVDSSRKVVLADEVPTLAPSAAAI